MGSQAVYGIHPAMACLSSAVTEVKRVCLRDGSLSPRLQALADNAEARGLAIERLPVEELDRLAQGSHQGVVLFMEEPKILGEAALTSIIDQAEGSLLLLILDGVTDPRNLGACLRSAATMGVDAVIVPKDKSAPLNGAAIKTASGAAAMVPVVQVVNLARALEGLKTRGVWVIGTILEPAEMLSTVDLTGPIALVMGAEGKGMRSNTRKHCDLLANIPMLHDDPGFNVSVAAGICLYEAVRQRVNEGG